MINVKCQIGLILLAAGESKRMGTPKQLLSYNGRSLIRHAAKEAVASNCESIMVVLGAYSDRISPELDNLRVHISHNAQWQKGMSSSIATGVKTILKIDFNLDAVIVALADQPLITAKTYNQLIDRYRETRAKAIASIYAQTIGVPALFDRDLFTKLSRIEGKDGAKQLLQRYTNPQDNLTVPEAAIDLDTPADYQQLTTVFS
jgi:molybdenum cofactor cytidylyltransferase